MLKTNPIYVHSQELMTFSKWTHKSYAVFSSLKKLIKISVLSFSCSLLSFSSITAFAQEDSLRIDKKLELEEFEVLSTVEPLVYNQQARLVSVLTKKEIAQSPESDLGSFLFSQRAVDIRSRGGFGVQSDLSIRGSSFDQVLVLLNGIPISDAQTGHFNLNMPFSPDAIQRIEILEGSAARVYGANAFAGAVNIVTQPKAKNQINLHAEGGQHDYYGLGLSANYNLGRSRTFVSYQKNGSDGYRENTEFQMQNFFLQSLWAASKYSLDLQVGIQQKDFGANGFYSVKYPLQYEHNRADFASINLSFGKVFHTRISSFWRRHRDQWVLTKENPSLYQNFHQSNTHGFKTNHRLNTKFGKIQLGSEIRSESIWSTSLGESQADLIPVPWDKNYNFSHYFERINASLFLDHQLQIGSKFYTSFGFLANWNSDYDKQIKIYPGLDISYKLYSNIQLIASVNQAMRLPTFTDLYYSGPANIGNAKLLPEKATSVEIGLKYAKAQFSIQTTYFSRLGKNMIDWVWLADIEKWQTQNILDQNTQGVEFGLVYHPISKKSFIQNIQFNYTYLDASMKEKPELTKYASTHLKHQMNFSSSLLLFPKFKLNLNFSYRDRVGVYQSYNFEEGKYLTEAYKDVFLLNLRAVYEHKHYSIFIDGMNLLDYKYVEYGVIQAGSWLKAGINIHLNRKNTKNEI